MAQVVQPEENEPALVLSHVPVDCWEHDLSDCSFFTHLCYFDEVSLAALASHRLWSMALEQILRMKKDDFSVCYHDIVLNFYLDPWLWTFERHTRTLLSQTLPSGLKKYFAKQTIIFACFPDREKHFYFTHSRAPAVLFIDLPCSFRCLCAIFRAVKYENFLLALGERRKQGNNPIFVQKAIRSGPKIRDRYTYTQPFGYFFQRFGRYMMVLQ